MDWLFGALPREVQRHVAACDDLTAAWRACPRASWLLHLALAGGVERTLVVRGAAPGVAAALSLPSPVTDLRTRRALVTARRWSRGHASAREAWADGFAAAEVAEHADGAAQHAALAAAYLAFACDEDADDVFYTHRAYAARAARHAEHALDGARDASPDTVRGEIPVAAFLEAVERRAHARPETPALLVRDETTDSFYC